MNPILSEAPPPLRSSYADKTSQGGGIYTRAFPSDAPRGRITHCVSRRVPTAIQHKN